MSIFIFITLYRRQHYQNLLNTEIKIYKTIILPVVLYGCVTRYLALRQVRRLRLFENRILRRKSLKFVFSNDSLCLVSKFPGITYPKNFKCAISLYRVIFNTIILKILFEKLYKYLVSFISIFSPGASFGNWYKFSSWCSFCLGLLLNLKCGLIPYIYNN